MNTGLPRQETVRRWPTWTGERSTSVVDSARTSRAGFRLSMNGQTVRGYAQVPGNSQVVYRLAFADAKVVELTLQYAGQAFPSGWVFPASWTVRRSIG